MKLGVNIDHIATLRNARGGFEPCLVDAVKQIMNEDILGVTMHLREDRRHIKDKDLYDVRELGVKINLEMASTEEIQKIALDLIPNSVCLVPEKRQEITTEGGLDAHSQKDFLKEYIKAFKEKNILVSLFIDADLKQVETAKFVGADYIELHTGSFANAFIEKTHYIELEKLKIAAKYAQTLGLKVNAGHGLNYENVYLMHEIEGLQELNIGHSIISKSIFTGLNKAVVDMIELIK